MYIPEAWFKIKQLSKHDYFNPFNVTPHIFTRIYYFSPHFYHPAHTERLLVRGRTQFCARYFEIPKHQYLEIISRETSWCGQTELPVWFSNTSVRTSNFREEIHKEDFLCVCVCVYTNTHTHTYGDLRYVMYVASNKVWCENHFSFMLRIVWLL
jgi:hypothetical protein